MAEVDVAAIRARRDAATRIMLSFYEGMRDPGLYPEVADFFIHAPDDMGALLDLVAEYQERYRENDQAADQMLSPTIGWPEHSTSLPAAEHFWEYRDDRGVWRCGGCGISQEAAAKEAQG